VKAGARVPLDLLQLSQSEAIFYDGDGLKVRIVCLIKNTFNRKAKSHNKRSMFRGSRIKARGYLPESQPCE
jgi:hypothetical protein